MNKGIYRIAAGVGAAVILVSSATAQAATVTANGTPAPVASDSIAGWPAAPAVTSETAVLIDADTGAVLYDKGMDEYRYPASTTKLMTLLVASVPPTVSAICAQTSLADLIYAAIQQSFIVIVSPSCALMLLLSQVTSLIPVSVNR